MGIKHEFKEQTPGSKFCECGKSINNEVHFSNDPFLKRLREIEMINVFNILRK